MTEKEKTLRVRRKERGWIGHFICGDRCRFRRNTLLECGEVKIVVSTVGTLVVRKKVETVGYKRFYETVAFHSDKKDLTYHDVDISRRVDFESEWYIEEMGKDNKANAMHERVVSELVGRLKVGELK